MNLRTVALLPRTARELATVEHPRHAGHTPTDLVSREHARPILVQCSCGRQLSVSTETARTVGLGLDAVERQLRALLPRGVVA